MLKEKKGKVCFSHAIFIYLSISFLTIRQPQNKHISIFSNLSVSVFSFFVSPQTHLFRQMTVNGEEVAVPEPHDLNHVITSQGLHPVLALNIHGCVTLIGASGFVVSRVRCY